MIISNLGNNYSSKSVKAKVELYDGYTLVATCTCSETGELFPGANSLSSFTMSRDGELGKFFGFGVCHKLEMTLIDLEKVLRLYEGYTAKVCLGNGTVWDCPYPKLDVTNVKVDKKSGDITVTAFDPLNKASELTYEDLHITVPYTLKTLAEACGALLGLEVFGVDGTEFGLSYAKGGNYNGDESVRSVLNHIAEATQTIYFINHNNELEFKRLSAAKVADYYRADYYEFEVESAKKINGICHATELGENLEAIDKNGKGVVQFIRDNPLMELREDLTNLLVDSFLRVRGMELQQYELDWSGDYRLEIGDCIAIHYDDEETYVHILNDKLTYSGTMDEESSWEWVDNESETLTNPINLGEKINQTFARVDKIEKEITLYVGDVVEEALQGKVDDIIDESLEGIVTDVNNLKAQQQTTTQTMSQLQLTTNSITSDVSSLKTSNTVITNQIGEVVAEQTNIKNSISSLQQKDDEILLSVSDLDSKYTTELEGVESKITQNSASLAVRDDEIVSMVKSVETNTIENIGGINSQLNELTKQVTTKVSPDDVSIILKEELSNGVDKVVTETGFTFDSDGLTVSKTGKEMTTTITEDGMIVYKNDAAMLTANNQGVDAKNLSASTYLTIGANSRLEDYKTDRTACFWIGG